MSLSVRHLELRSRTGVSLLGPLDLEVPPGARVALVGESGSGKSLLVRALMGALPPGVQSTGGTIEVVGLRTDLPGVARDQARQRLAWIPQEPLLALNPLVRIQDHLALLPRIRGLAPRDPRPLLERLLLPAEPAFLRRFPLELSGGQRQRLVVAMGLLADPEFLVLDEPTSALDPVAREALLGLLDELHRDRGLGWLWITHDLEVAGAVADLVQVIYGGSLLEAGPARQVLGQPRHPYTRRLREAFLGLPPSESGFLEAPPERGPGCPYQPRCPWRLPHCGQWAPWRGTPDSGLRCEVFS